MTKRIAGIGSALLLLVLWCTDTQGIFPYFFAAAAVHELGHLAAMMMLGARVESIRVEDAGLVIRYGRSLSYGGDAIVALAGPAINLITAILNSYLTACGVFSMVAYRFSGAGIVLGLFNLLPALPLDGGGALYSLLAQRWEPDRAMRAVRRSTMICGAGMCVVGLYILIKTRYNMSMLASGSLIIGGLYAERTGKGPAKGAKARTLRWRRVRAD